VSATAICPVCGHEVDAENPVGGSYEYEGQTYHFCTEKEREAFAANPERILERAARRAGSRGPHHYGHAEAEGRGA
jgi:Cu2+-exporting ATPase